MRDNPRRMFNKGTFCSPEFVTFYKKVTGEIIPEKCSTKGHFVAPILLHFTKTSRGDNSRRMFNKGVFCSPEFVIFYK
jgi:hypothetical protein